MYHIFLFVSVEGVAIALAINMHLIIPLKTYSIYQKQHENKQASACQMDKRSTSTLAAQCTPPSPTLSLSPSLYELLYKVSMI